MASKLSDRSISKFDVETLFRDVFTLQQIKQVGNLLKLLGLYVFLERSQLDYFAENHYAEKIGLATLQLAVKYNLITEIQSEDDIKRFYFQLKSAGYYFLDAIIFEYRQLPLDAAVNEREKILSINYFLISKGYKLANTTFLFEPLITTKGVLLVYKKTEKDGVIRKMLDENPTLTLEKMYLTDVHLNGHSKGNLDSMLLG